jgi:hypothetical protein
MKFRFLLLLILFIVLYSSCSSDRHKSNQLELVETKTPEFVDIAFSEAKNIYEVKSENLSLDRACESVSYNNQKYDLGKREKNGDDVNYFYCNPSWMKLDDKIVLKLTYGAESPQETLLVFLDSENGFKKLTLETGGEYDYKFVYTLVNNYLLAAINGNLYNIDLDSETLIEKHELKFRSFGDQTKEILVKDSTIIEVIRSHEDGGGRVVETINLVASLKL